MENTQRLKVLKRLRKEMRQSLGFMNVEARRDFLSQLVPLLNFNDVYYANALRPVDILGRPNFSVNAYEQSYAQLDSLVGQAITELEHELTPPLQSRSKGDNKGRPAITISNSNIGILNTGQVESIGSITLHVQNLAASGNPDVAKALNSLAEAIGASREVSEHVKSEALDQLDELARQAAVEPHQRAKLGVIKSLFQGLATTLSAAGGLAEVWSTWGHEIRKFFGF